MIEFRKNAVAFGLAGCFIAALGDLSESVVAQDGSSATGIQTLFVIGDSTASKGAYLGWGSHFGKFFDPAKLRVVNRARGGRSSRTFQIEGLWERVRDDLEPGDFVLIQFGHNDGGQINRDRARGSLRGLGEETQTVTNGTGTVETVHTFGWYLRNYVADTRAKGAKPIILSLTVRNEWKDGKVERGPGQYSNWSEAVAKSEQALFLDLNNLIGEHYEKLGPEKVKSFFPRDHTHTSAEGAELNARLVVVGLRGLDTHPLDEFLSLSGREIQPEKPKQ